MRALALACGGVLLAGCAGLHENPYYDPAKPDHTPTGFRNIEHAAQKSEGFWRWAWRWTSCRTSTSC